MKGCPFVLRFMLWKLPRNLFPLKFNFHQWYLLMSVTRKRRKADFDKTEKTKKGGGPKSRLTMFDKDVRKTRSQINDRKYLVKFTPRAGFAFVFASILNFIQFCPLRGAALCVCQTRHQRWREEVNNVFFSVTNAHDLKILLIRYQAFEFHHESSWKPNFLISRNKS